MSETQAHRPYLPAAGHHWALPFYDSIVRVTGAHRVREVLLAQAGLRPGHRVLDVGCGTGSFVVLVKQRHPEVEIVGIDPDPRALARAARKADRAGLALRLDRGYADALPYPAGSFDRVLSTFVLHHLETAVKGAALREMRRVLRPGGALHLLDADGGGHAHGLARLVHFHARLRDNDGERIVSLLHAAGFSSARRTTGGRMALGLATYSCYEAVRGDED